MTEKLPVGADVHIAMTFTTIDQSASSLGIKDTAASNPDITIPMPSLSFDVEFKTTDRQTDIFYCYFDKNVTDVQIDVSSIIVEKIV